MNRRRLISASASCVVSRERAVLRVLGVLPEQHHADAGGQNGGAVDERPLPRVLLGRGVVEHQVRHEAGADPVAEHREHDVEQERHPVLIERDEPDDDEEVEVRLDRAVGEADERGRAVDQPERDERGGQPPGPHEVSDEQAGQRQRQRLGDVVRREAAQHAEDEQGRQVRCEQPLQEPVSTVPLLVTEGVALGQIVEHRRHAGPPCNTRGYSGKGRIFRLRTESCNRIGRILRTVTNCVLKGVAQSF